MPKCNTHQQNYAKTNGGCPDCDANEANRSYRGMNTPLLKVGNIHSPRVNGKPWEEPLDAPAKSTHVRQR